MCGIVGLIRTIPSTEDSLREVCLRMADTLKHRGPDDSGVWVDARYGIALGHRRLSILDLSPEGRQPMISTCGRYVIAFNGEVYNYRSIGKELENQGSAPAFRGSSDTEVMLAAISAWGLTTAVNKFIGMFAFALWDQQDKTLFLVRDRIGIKPLYYGWAGKNFVFASELKALRVHPEFSGEIDPAAVELYFRHMYIPAPYSIYKEVFKLEPGHILTIDTENLSGIRHSQLSTEPYWLAGKVYLAGTSNPWPGNDDEAEVELERLLTDSIALRMISDVPIGAFLSGGVDSSTVVALMQSLSNRPVRTFSIGFHEWGYDEALYARQVAAHLGTDHTELYVTEKQAIEIIPSLPEIYDEPFADSSQIPTILVSRLARQNVTVSLSGDGGDELFLGYPRYSMIGRTWNQLRNAPLPLRSMFRSLIQSIPENIIESLRWPLSPMFRVLGRKPTDVGQWLHRVAGYVDQNSLNGLYSQITDSMQPGCQFVKCPSSNKKSEQYSNIEGKLHDYQLMSLIDLTNYLPDDILVKVDRASMSVGLEARVPILDHRVVEFAARIPVNMKIRDGLSKCLLRRVLYKYVPQHLIERPKQGFAVPLERWFAGPLRNWVEDTLSDKAPISNNYLDADVVKKIRQEHFSGKPNWASTIWSILMFQSWLDTQA